MSWPELARESYYDLLMTLDQYGLGIEKNHFYKLASIDYNRL